MTEPEQGARDFTIHREPIQFRIDDDVFKAPAILSPIALKNLAVMHASLGDGAELTRDVGRAVDLVADMFVMLLPGPSGRRFKERLRSQGREADPEADPPLPADPLPIDLQRQALPALYYLLEQYGLRPTTPSSPSPDGSTDGQTNTPNGGTSSMDGPSPTESTTVDSTQPTG
jgi:hypothetical protein